MLLCTPSGARKVADFNSDWKFCLETSGSLMAPERPEFDDSQWRILNLPHDWAIEGDFDRSNPSGTGGGALPGGKGWYRKSFRVDKKMKQMNVSIEFDGIYMNSSVWINGHLLGTRPYGYISFSYDITPYLNWDSDNTITVLADNSDQPNSRWYSGCGIYRDVRLVATNPVHVEQWGTYVTAELKDNEAIVKVETTIANSGSSNATGISVRQSILSDSKPLQYAQATTGVPDITKAGKTSLTQEITLKKPLLWSIDKPYMYILHTEVLSQGKIVDQYDTPFGIRDIRFDAEKGFFLNGEHVSINGVCLHHDLGALGAAFNESAMEYRLRLLKEMGCNAIRCSHNPPAPQLLDLCDRMGFLVMDESFDMWRRRKTERDYARFFDRWFRQDLTDMVLRDRNHPSIILWSIGNEVLEQWSDASADTLSLEQANMILNAGHKVDELDMSGNFTVNAFLTSELAGIVRKLDQTRPVTAGCNEPSPGNHLFRSGAIDVIGYNYHNQNVAQVPRLFPGKPFILTESVSGLMTRGYYRMPSDEITICPPRWDLPYYDPSFACSSYDNCRVPWGNTHEETLLLQKNTPFAAGQFVWTGFDYIGEPTPYGWPARSSYFGIIDLAGFPKDIYHLYRSEWSDNSELHLFPHWNWVPGDTIDMWCYYNQADSVQLFINGKPMGTRKKDSNHLHVSWRVVFEPGNVAVAAWKDGNIRDTREIRTAGNPYMVELVPDRTSIKSDGKDIDFITVNILDKDGNICPNAENLVEFSVEGAAFIAGVDNGSPISMERFKADHRKAMAGKCMLMVQNNGKRGKVTISASSAGLKSHKVTLNSW